jgi:DNA-binding transcriptional LysR family regulator
MPSRSGAEPAAVAVELRHLRAFVAVAEELHFGRAAERLHMAQPPFSQLIRRVERELGVMLLFRTTRSVELSPAGEVFLVRARSILTAADQAQDETRRAARGEFGRLVVSFTGSATFAILPSLTVALRSRLPGVELDLRGDMLTPAQVAGLADGSIDVALLRPPVRDPRVRAEVVRRETLLAVLPGHHPLAAEAAVPLELLRDEPFITYPSHARSVVHDAVETACEAHGFVPRVALEVGETATLVSFVAAGLGVSLVPESVARLTIEGAVYRPLTAPTQEIELAVAWRRDGSGPVVERALEIIRREVPALPTQR